ncbi:pseudouridine synthase [Lampropedia aestuarii]|uniref:Pseudouridine synthase n=1 Tax=Lampropedia aestuarii TaxID=2562762 RepID=A0A4V3YX15_9BURK|nr:pseudouridine synthase [Lampropedia aestuarii]MDH5856221.1 pseudouridine synthase [Lampropedia aestuarii]THJ33502.1 pseudouridine synthase [Lampropedia aestuarii]
MPPSSFPSKRTPSQRSNARRAPGLARAQRGRAQPPQGPGRLILLNKPWGVLTQFRDDQGRATLADYVQVPGVYPAGRLDMDSEGLLLLTNDGALQARIAHPAHKMEKTYWAQVEGVADEAQLAQLARGVQLNDGMTLPAKAERLPDTAEQQLWPRDPPVRFRQSIPTSWIALTIAEGKNRQVRRMTAAVGLPTLRLVRVRIGPWALDGLPLGQWRELAIPVQL